MVKTRMFLVKEPRDMEAVNETFQQLEKDREDCEYEYEETNQGLLVTIEWGEDE